MRYQNARTKPFDARMIGRIFFNAQQRLNERVKANKTISIKMQHLKK